jgi:hypothetical protein
MLSSSKKKQAVSQTGVSIRNTACRSHRKLFSTKQAFFQHLDKIPECQKHYLTSIAPQQAALLDNSPSLAVKMCFMSQMKKMAFLEATKVLYQPQKMMPSRTVLGMRVLADPV